MQVQSIKGYLRKNKVSFMVCITPNHEIKNFSFYRKLKKYTNTKVVIFLPEERDLFYDFTKKSGRIRIEKLLKSNNIELEWWLSDPSADHIPSGIKGMKIINWPLYTVPWTWYMMEHQDIKPIQKFNKIFITLNNKPRKHRYWLMDEIYKRQLQNDGYITWHGPDCQKNIWLKKEPTYYFKNKLLTLDAFDPKQQGRIPEEFFKSFINVVAETDHQKIDITEKTYVPMICKKPFIIVGATGVHERLKYFGFRLFDFIDYSFDFEPDHKTRISMIVEQIEQLRDKDLNTLYQQSLPVLEHNYNRIQEIMYDNTYAPAEFRSITKKVFVNKNQYQLGATKWIHQNYYAKNISSTSS